MKRWDVAVGIMFNSKDYKSLWLAYMATGVTRMAEKGFQTTRPHQAMFIYFIFSNTILSAPKFLWIF